MFKDLYEMTCMLFHLYGDVYRYVSHDIWVGSALRLLGPNADFVSVRRVVGYTVYLGSHECCPP